MMRYAILFLSLASNLAHADIIEKNKNEQWNVEGLAHYIRSKENKRFSANLIAVGNNSSIVAFHEPYTYCRSRAVYKKVKIQYQWVNYVSQCIGGDNFWMPNSQKGKDFVKQEFSRNADVKVVFESENYTFSTKKFASVKQHWERTVKTSGNAL
ncbi:hypothetical protein OPW36_20725 [Vibrio europaeus]|uniref:Uncharacterized protein n=2 Tax=Vibrio europaeus TaxID=300876 RepID=A0A178JDY6_9VIBR|nr:MULTISPECIES: hypothetical protein [Vibrio oreintalis group]MDC5706394.1 hypothetical protein [Vibrio europaeus]MDC5711709.1 hypothetical protein [Vibrio europaeus]MDC5716184.1 hypothetical protein [Vibrio europaeus]MDC5723189.1 hypothetical protein [Vibrio europaeus]MDC5728414.1 hypothetical protein [Vibrio europaeus]